MRNIYLTAYNKTPRTSPRSTAMRALGIIDRGDLLSMFERARTNFPDAAWHGSAPDAPDGPTKFRRPRVMGRRRASA